MHCTPAWAGLRAGVMLHQQIIFEHLMTSRLCSIFHKAVLSYQELDICVSNWSQGHYLGWKWAWNAGDVVAGKYRSPDLPPLVAAT